MNILIPVSKLLLLKSTNIVQKYQKFCVGIIPIGCVYTVHGKDELLN